MKHGKIKQIMKSQIHILLNSIRLGKIDEMNLKCKYTSIKSTRCNFV